MPTISLFYEIIIYANYAEYDAVISIPENEVLKGEMPNKKLKLIKAWIVIHQQDLMANWKLAIEGQQPHKIEPLRWTMLKVKKSQCK